MSGGRIEWHIDLHIDRILDIDPREGMKDAADHIIDRADERAPILAGEDLAEHASYAKRAQVTELVDSHYTKADQEREAEFGYSADYAVYQHEKTWWHHAHGEPKWLERTVNEEAETALGKITDGIRMWLDEHNV